MNEPAFPIATKRIYEPPAVDDGARVLVDRLWPRSISKERAALTLWLKEAAPSTALRRWFGHDPGRWAAFQEGYRAELDANAAVLEPLRQLARTGKLTLLYGAHDQIHNHAVVLAAYLRTTLAASKTTTNR
jgi:uncharacterized protein YeaO (DUF488 family)